MDNPVAIYFCGIFIYWHGLIMALAGLCAAACAVLLRKARGESAKDILFIALTGFVPSMVLGRIFYCYFMQEAFADKSQMLKIGDGGIAFYGFAAGYVITIILYCLVRRINLLQMLDDAAPAAAVGICIGRIASFFSGDDLGRAVENENLQHLPIAVFSAERGEWNLAVFTFEAIAALVIFALLAAMLWLKGTKHIVIRDGDIVLMFMLLYGIPQTVFESMRMDSLFLISLGFVRISQVISIIVATVPFVLFSIRSAKKGVTAFHWIIWAVCLCGIALAFWMEFCMTSATAVRNYTVMSICLADYLLSGVALYLSAALPKLSDGD